MEKISLFLSHILDCMGYSSDMILLRRKTLSYINSNLKCSGTPLLTLGTPCEGLTHIFDGEYEIMLVKGNVKCTTTDDFRMVNCIHVYAETGKSSIPPGYTRLLRVGSGADIYDEDIANSLEKEDSKWYLSSKRYDSCMRQKIKAPEIKIRILCHIGSKHHSQEGTQCVTFPLVLVGKNLIKTFVERNRPHGWPSNSLIHEMLTSKCYVYPDGSNSDSNDFSDFPDGIWRISFKGAEHSLVNSLNITLLKLYILLRMLCRAELQHIAKQMTSYLMKNLVFWMAESYPGDIFSDQNLVLLLLTSLGMLYNCVKVGCFPCYLIPERNLLYKLSFTSKHNLLHSLTQLQSEKACMLVRCEKLKCIMLSKFSIPDIVEIYQDQRDRLEAYVLTLNMIQSYYACISRTKMEYERYINNDPSWLNLAKVIYQMVLPEWPGLHKSGMNTPSEVIQRLKEILQ